MEHKKPTPGDDYCNNCGLQQEYWDEVPECPAPVDFTVDLDVINHREED